MLVINDDYELLGDYSMYYIYEVNLKTLPYFINELKEQGIASWNLKSMIEEINNKGAICCLIRKKDKSDTPILDYFSSKPSYNTHIYKPKLKLKYNKPSLGGSTIQK